MRSNNTFLELLATVGIVGLAAFGFVIVSAKYTWRPASLALGVFLLHAWWMFSDDHLDLLRVLVASGVRG